MCYMVQFKYGMTTTLLSMLPFAKDEPYIRVMSLNDKTTAQYKKLLHYPNPARLIYFLQIFNNFFSFIFLKFFFLHTLRINFFIPSCIPFLSILTYALPMDGIGFLSNSDSYVILGNAFPSQGVKNLHLMIFVFSSYTQLVAMELDKSYCNYEILHITYQETMLKCYFLFIKFSFSDILACILQFLPGRNVIF